jgi:hypothetical protein
MAEEKWSEDLTEEQTQIMKILGGVLANIADLFDLMTKNMPERKAYLCKLAYLESLGKTLDLDLLKKGAK